MQAGIEGTCRQAACANAGRHQCVGRAYALQAQLKLQDWGKRHLVDPGHTSAANVHRRLVRGVLHTDVCEHTC